MAEQIGPRVEFNGGAVVVVVYYDDVDFYITRITADNDGSVTYADVTYSRNDRVFSVHQTIPSGHTQWSIPAGQRSQYGDVRQSIFEAQFQA